MAVTASGHLSARWHISVWKVRMMLRNQADNEILEVRYRGDENYQAGNEVTLTL